MAYDNITKVADADFPTRWGHFRILGFEGIANVPVTKIDTAVALVMGDIHSNPPLVRIHSQCLTGDVFHSLRCDCRQQLQLAPAKMAEPSPPILLTDQQHATWSG